MAGFWKSEKELFSDTLKTYFRRLRHNIGSIDYPELSYLIDEINLLIYLGSDLFNEDWDDFFFDISSPEHLAKAIGIAQKKAKKLMLTNPDAISIKLDPNTLETLLDQNYCVNGIQYGTPLAKTVQRVIRNAKSSCTPYCYYYYLLKTYKTELNNIIPINPFCPF